MARKRTSKESDRDGSMAFSEFSSTEPAATRNFLEKVFGWQFESVEFPMGEYLSFRTPGGGQGGIRPTQAKELPGSTSYVRFADLDAARKKVERAGGEIVLPRVDVPGMGSFFWFRAPGGPILAAWQDSPALPSERE
jgi:predicted enzyme related to lactoylglutathione lyase